MRFESEQTAPALREGGVTAGGSSAGSPARSIDDGGRGGFAQEPRAELPRAIEQESVEGVAAQSPGRLGKAADFFAASEMQLHPADAGGSRGEEGVPDTQTLEIVLDFGREKFAADFVTGEFRFFDQIDGAASETSRDRGRRSGWTAAEDGDGGWQNFILAGHGRMGPDGPEQMRPHDSSNRRISARRSSIANTSRSSLPGLGISGGSGRRGLRSPSSISRPLR